MIWKQNIFSLYHSSAIYKFPTVSVRKRFNNLYKNIFLPEDAKYNCDKYIKMYYDAFQLLF